MDLVDKVSSFVSSLFSSQQTITENRSSNVAAENKQKREKILEAFPGTFAFSRSLTSQNGASTSAGTVKKTAPPSASNLPPKKIISQCRLSDSQASLESSRKKFALYKGLKDGSEQVYAQQIYIRDTQESWKKSFSQFQESLDALRRERKLNPSTESDFLEKFKLHAKDLHAHGEELLPYLKGIPKDRIDNLQTILDTLGNWKDEATLPSLQANIFRPSAISSSAIIPMRGTNSHYQKPPTKQRH